MTKKKIKKSLLGAINSIVFVDDLNSEFPVKERELSSCIKTLPAIISRQPHTKVRFSVQFHKLRDDASVHSARGILGGYRYLNK